MTHPTTCKQPVNILDQSQRPTQKAELIARLQSSGFTITDDENALQLCITPQGLGLQRGDNPKIKPVSVDFVSGKAAWRRGQAELIARAVAVKKLPNPTVIDATAGLGKDAFVLASLGCHVTLIERNAIIAELLKDGLKRAQENSATQTIANNMTLIFADAEKWLKNLPDSQQPAVIYLDPMYPAREKSAKVKKDMQLFHQLLHKTDHGESLLPIAQQKATHRVVIKRPIKGHFLNQQKPDFSLKGRSTRFDVYLSHR